MSHVPGIRDHGGVLIEFSEFFISFSDEDQCVGGVVARLMAEAVVDERSGERRDVLLATKGKIGLIRLEDGLFVPSVEKLIDS